MSHALNAAGGSVALGGASTCGRGCNTVIYAPLMATQHGGGHQHVTIVHVSVVRRGARGLSALQGGVEDVGIDGMGV